MVRKSLEIVTTQNVTLEYPLATLSERIFSTAIDFFLLIVLYNIINIFGSIIFSYTNYTYYTYFGLAVIVFYSLTCEYFRDGQSFGKQMMGIKVVKINGNEARLSDYLARWVFRLVDIFLSVGTVAMFLISSTARSQRLGDIVANTTVIKIKPEYSLTLNRIMSIKSIDDYKPVYNQVMQMKEEEMLEIKSILQETIKYPNNNHLKQLHELRKILSERLRIEDTGRSDREFLQQLINDYIVLTR